MSPFAVMLAKLLKKIEWIAIIVAFLGLAFKILNLSGYANLIMVGISTLACSYFLSAYVMLSPSNPNEKTKKGFADLLTETILPKLLYIGLAVFCVGFLFSVLHFNGANEMMLISLITLVGGTLFSMILILANRDRMKVLQPPLIRCIVALITYFTLPLLK